MGKRRWAGICVEEDLQVMAVTVARALRPLARALPLPGLVIYTLWSPCETSTRWHRVLTYLCPPLFIPLITTLKKTCWLLKGKRSGQWQDSEEKFRSKWVSSWMVSLMSLVPLLSEEQARIYSSDSDEGSEEEKPQESKVTHQ